MRMTDTLKATLMLLFLILTLATARVEVSPPADKQPLPPTTESTTTTTTAQRSHGLHTSVTTA